MVTIPNLGSIGACKEAVVASTVIIARFREHWAGFYPAGCLQRVAGSFVAKETKLVFIGPAVGCGKC